MMTTPILIFSIVLVVTSVALALFVLMHKGRGGGLSDLFGGGISSSMGGSSVAERNLDRLTIIIGVVWLAVDRRAGPALQARRLSGRATARHDVEPPSSKHCSMTRRTNVAGGSAIRGSRVGAGPMGEAERGDAAPRLYVSYFCAHGHETRPAFAADAQIPETWDCPRCGLPANLDSLNPPPPPKIEPYKTHLAYVKERRCDAEAADILTEALQALRARRARRRGHLLSRVGPSQAS